MDLQQHPQLVLSHTTGAKRERDDDADLPDPSKRLRADLACVLEDILDDADDSSATGDLASVMRSLEEEIGLSSPAPVAPEEESRQPELGFLLEASDDELGLPPTMSEEAEEDFCDPGADGFGQIWGFEDEIRDCYSGFDLGFVGEEAVAGSTSEPEAEGMVFHGGLFDGLGDEDYTWRQETMPTV